MLPYFEKTSPKDWNVDDILKAAESGYPMQDRSYHIFIAKEDLKALKQHTKKGHREAAEELLSAKWKLPPKKAQEGPVESRLSVVNKAKYQRNYQTINNNVLAGSSSSEDPAPSTASTTHAANPTTTFIDSTPSTTDQSGPEKRTFSQVFDDEIESDHDTTVSPAPQHPEFHRLVFKHGYKHFQGTINLHDIAQLNQLAARLSPTTLGEHLDHLSHRLIGSGTNSAIEATLKMTLSRVIYLVGGSTYPIYKSYFSSSQIKQLRESKPTIGAGLTDSNKRVFESVVHLAKKEGISAARIQVSQLRIEELSKGLADNQTSQVLDILDLTLSTLTTAVSLSSKSKTSELSYYRRCALVLDIIFRDCPEFELNDGETTCNATKIARIHNKKLCDDNEEKKTVIGRKIDLLIRTLSMDISSSEWKKDSAGNLGEVQQVKNARTNSAILKEIHRLPIPEDDIKKVFVLGMDWIGLNGYMLAVVKNEDAHVVHHIGDLQLPMSLAALDDFEVTLDLLYAFKGHQLRLKEIIEPIHYRVQNATSLDRYRIKEDIPEPNEDAPKTFFTPVKKREKQKKSKEKAPATQSNEYISDSNSDDAGLVDY